MKPSLRSFSQNVLSQVVVQIFLVARAVIVIPILAKTVGEFYYGIWSQIIITITLLSSLFTLRFDIAFVRFFTSPKSEADAKKAFSSMLSVILLALLIVGSVYMLFLKQVSFFVFGQAALNQYAVILLALLSLKTIFMFSLSYYRSSHRIVLYSVIQSIQILGEIGVLFFAIIIYDATLLQALEVLILFNSIITIITLVSVLFEIGIQISGFSFLKPYILFSLPLIPNVSLQWVVNFSDRYVITHLLDVNSAGIYAASFELGRFVSFFVTPIAFVIYPTISKLWEEDDRNEIKFWMINSLKLFLFFGIPAVAGIHYFASIVLLKLASERFAQHQWLASVIGVGFLCVGIFQLYVYLMHLKKKTLSILIIFIIVAILNVVLNFLMVPIIGIEGAAIASLISYFVQAVSVYMIANKGFNIGLPVGFITKAIISCGIMLAFLMSFNPGAFTKNLFLIISGSGIYFLMMLLTKAIGKKELDILKSMIPF